jgi:hypothetical protein
MPVSEKLDLLDRRVKILAGTDNEKQRSVQLGLALKQIIWARYRCPDTEVRCAQDSCKPFSDQIAFSNEYN